MVALAATGWSYARALTGPGNDSIAIRSTEWLKDHYFSWAVNDVERWWYTHHQPRRGGVPTGALRHTIQPSPAPTAPSSLTPSPPTTTPSPLHLPAPPPVAPFAADPLPGEGQWKPLGAPVNGTPAMYAAFLRPDSTHTSLVTAVAWIDPLLARFSGYAGALEPGGGPWTNRAPIPSPLRPGLLAAFNSGFKMRDARGGYYADGRTARPLVSGAATMVISPNGVPNIGEWGRDFTLGPSVAFARQNLALIVDGGRPVADLATANVKWGA
ncbi:MAG: hypothetical protein ACHQNA_11970, partial [Acidimicrobiales bacterium]